MQKPGQQAKWACENQRSELREKTTSMKKQKKTRKRIKIMNPRIFFVGAHHLYDRWPLRKIPKRTWGIFKVI